MATKLAIGTTKRVQDLQVQAALDELKTKLEWTIGAEPPDTATTGRIYLQIQADSYTRLWVKDPATETWK
jgi:hypothetical protein